MDKTQFFEHVLQLNKKGDTKLLKGDSIKRYVVGLEGIKASTVGGLVEEIDKLFSIYEEKIHHFQNVTIGAWEDNGIIYIDIGTSTDDLTRAVNLGTYHNQLAIYDTQENKCINI